MTLRQLSAFSFQPAASYVESIHSCSSDLVTGRCEHTPADVAATNGRWAMHDGLAPCSRSLILCTRGPGIRPISYSHFHCIHLQMLFAPEVFEACEAQIAIMVPFSRLTRATDPSGLPHPSIGASCNVIRRSTAIFTLSFDCRCIESRVHDGVYPMRAYTAYTTSVTS